MAVNIEGERFWMYSSIDAETNDILHVKLFNARNHALARNFMCDLNEKQKIGVAEFLGMEDPGYKPYCPSLACTSATKNSAGEIKLYVSIKK